MTSTADAIQSESLQFTPEVFSTSEGVLFSVYGVNFGYRAFALSYEAACEHLGALHQSRRELMLAFQLNRPRIARAILQKSLPSDGRRVILEAADFI